MKKTEIKKIAGGTKITITGQDGNKTISYDGIKNLHIGQTYTYNVSNASHAATSNTSRLWAKPTSTANNSSSAVKTGVTFKKVESLNLNSKEINKMFSSKNHKTYENSKDYTSAAPTSVKKS